MEAARSPFVVAVTEDDLPRLRRLRDAIYALRSEDQKAVAVTAVARGSISLEFNADGVSVSIPAGSASQRIRAAVLAECYEASIKGNLTRLRPGVRDAMSPSYIEREWSAVGHDSQICEMPSTALGAAPARPVGKRSPMPRHQRRHVR